MGVPGLRINIFWCTLGRLPISENTQYGITRESCGSLLASQQAWGSEFVKQQQDMDSGGGGLRGSLAESFLLSTAVHTVACR